MSRTRDESQHVIFIIFEKISIECIIYTISFLFVSFFYQNSFCNCKEKNLKLMKFPKSSPFCEDFKINLLPSNITIKIQDQSKFPRFQENGYKAACLFSSYERNENIFRMIKFHINHRFLVRRF